MIKISIHTVANGYVVTDEAAVTDEPQHVFESFGALVSYLIALQSQNAKPLTQPAPPDSVGKRCRTVAVSRIPVRHLLRFL